ncbi:hypothetical protein BsWGS_26572 [Bradybaena similaris]
MDLAQDLTCPVCLELFSRPVILPCSHVLCRRPCAETILEGSFIRCPVCRENSEIIGDVSNLPRIYTIENIIEKVRVWQKQIEDCQSIVARRLTPILTNDSGLPTMSENRCWCSPIKSFSSSSIIGVNSKGAELKTNNPNIMANKHVDQCRYCDRATFKYNIYGAPDFSCSDCKIATLTSCMSPASDCGSSCYHQPGISQATDCSSSNCRIRRQLSISQAGGKHLTPHLKRQVHEQLRKLSEVQRQFLDAVASYRTCAHVVGDSESDLVSTGPSLVRRLSAVLQKCNLILTTFDSKMRSANLSKERAQQGDVTYPATPSQPIIDDHRSSRGNTSVALVISPPSSCNNISSYEITYFTDEQKHKNVKKHQNASWPVNASSACKQVTFVLLEELSESTVYYFSACAVNSTGRSLPSEHVTCRTLSQHHCVVPAPVIMKNLCQASKTSVTIVCPSPRWVTRSQSVTHFVLHRQDGGDFLWQGEEMWEAEEHLVEDLEPGTDYQFVVLARSLRGECQISEKFNVKTCTEHGAGCV